MTNAVALAQGASNNVTFRNRIINGAMVVNQRATTVTNTAAWVYTVDRFAVYGSQASKFTAAQSSTAPAGFYNSLLLTSSSAYSLTAPDEFLLKQPIEGYNIADLNWGSSNAKTVVLSFWVQSSLTGLFSGNLRNATNDRCYVFSYTISAANTWQQIAITVPGDTTGTWNTTNGVGIAIWWTIGTGSTYLGTAGSWGTTAYDGATGTTSLVGTNGATLYITGVQLEAGTTASPFEYRQYGTELLLCQRYYETTAYPDVTFTSASTRGGVVYVGGNNSSGFNFLVPKRSNSPTVTLYSRSNTSGAVSLVATGADVTGCTASGLNATGFRITALGSAQTAGVGVESAWVASSEL